MPIDFHFVCCANNTRNLFVKKSKTREQIRKLRSDKKKLILQLAALEEIKDENNR